MRSISAGAIAAATNARRMNVCPIMTSGSSDVASLKVSAELIRRYRAAEPSATG